MEKQQEKEPKTTIYKKNKNQKTIKPRLKSTPTRLRKPLRKLSQQVNVGFRNPLIKSIIMRLHGLVQKSLSKENFIRLTNCFL